MNDFNVIRPENADFSEMVSGGKQFQLKKAFEEETIQAAKNKHNEKIDQMNEKIDNYLKDLEEVTEKAKSLTGSNAEIKALSNNVIIQPFKTNPFQKIRMEGNIMLLDGMAPTYKSNETGEYEEEEAFIHTGYVWDVGPECKWLKEGDIVMWTKPSEMMIPFYNFGLVSVNECRILAVINEKLTERFNDGK